MSVSAPSRPQSLKERVQALGVQQRRQIFSDTLLEADLRWWTAALRDEIALQDKISFTRPDLEAMASVSLGAPLGMDAIVSALVSSKVLLPASDLDVMRTPVNETKTTMASAVGKITSLLWSMLPSTSPVEDRFVAVSELERACDAVKAWSASVSDATERIMTLNELTQRFPVMKEAWPWLQARRQGCYVWRSESSAELGVTVREPEHWSSTLPPPSERAIFIHDSAVLKFRPALAALTASVSRLEQRVIAGRARAVTLSKAGDRARAVAVLRGVRSAQTALEQQTSMRESLERALDAVQQQTLSAHVLQALQAGNAALKSNARVSVDDVDEALDELCAAIEEQRETASALSERGEELLPSEARDEAALEEELSALLAEQRPPPTTAITVAAKTAASAQQNEVAMEELMLELESLHVDKGEPAPSSQRVAAQV